MPKTQTSISNILFRLLGLTILDAFALWFIYQSVADGGVGLFIATAIGLITVGINIAFLREEFYPFRWFAPGLTLMILLVVYPVLFTVYLAFTNNGTAHLLTKEQVITQLEKTQYTPEGGIDYQWVGYQSEAGDFLLLITPESGESLLLAPDQTLNIADFTVGPADEDGNPQTIGAYTKIPPSQKFRSLSELTPLTFGTPPNGISIKNPNIATRQEQKYVFDASQNIIADQETGTIYTPKAGTFTAPDGNELRPGFYVVTGFTNFSRLFGSPAFRGPFVQIFLWTFIYAFFAVFLTFSLGLFFAIVYNDPSMPARKLVRSLLLVPYAIPAFISVQMWRGLLNPNLGVISTTMDQMIGWVPEWFSDPLWAKIGILFVQLWLGYPYMMLVCTGALQAIPSDLYEAADVDGATIFHKFWHITLPLLLVAVGPLLIASFAFNFNNFTVIDVYNQGGPPIPNSPTQAGYTDILITYTFRLAFASGRGIDYGYASAITIVIFFILALITIAQFRYTQSWEEISKNV